MKCMVTPSRVEILGNTRRNPRARPSAQMLFLLHARPLFYARRQRRQLDCAIITIFADVPIVYPSLILWPIHKSAIY
jgi:hypothetical protein